jgi:hypothetical protein
MLPLVHACSVAQEAFLFRKSDQPTYPCDIPRLGILNPTDDREKAVVRKAGSITIQLVVQPTLCGKDKVSALTLGGRCVFQAKFREQDRVLLQDIRDNVQAALMGTGGVCASGITGEKLATSSTKIFFTKNGVTLKRGNCVVKNRAQPEPRTSLTHKEFESACHNRPISMYFKKKGDKPFLHKLVPSLLYIEAR